MRQDMRKRICSKKIPLELWLMLASAGGDTAKIQSLLYHPVNWGLLLQLAIYHKVYPLAYKTLSKLNDPAVPEHVFDFLRQKYQENAIKALNMTGETVRIVKCLESQGIRVVVLKGAPLASHLYGDIVIRPSGDIDILVKPEELEKAVRIIEDEGYCRIDNEHNLTSRQLKIFLKAHTHSFHLNYWHNEKKVNLELHWKTGDRGYEFPFPNASNINRIEVAGSPLPVLSDEEWLLYLMLHGAGHGWERLRWLVDIKKFMQKDIDWNKILIIAKNIGMESILSQSLLLANGLLAVPVPGSLLSIVANDRSALQLACMAISMCLTTVNYGIRDYDNEDINYGLINYNFQVRKGWKVKFKYILKRLGPTVHDIKLISLPDKLYALYYVIRPFIILGRHLQKFRTGN